MRNNYLRTAFYAAAVLVSARTTWGSKPAPAAWSAGQGDRSGICREVRAALRDWASDPSQPQRNLTPLGVFGSDGRGDPRRPDGEVADGRKVRTGAFQRSWTRFSRFWPSTEKVPVPSTSRAPPPTPRPCQVPARLRRMWPWANRATRRSWPSRACLRAISGSQRAAPCPGAIAPGAGVGPHRHGRHAAADLGGADALVGTVVSLLQLVADLVALARPASSQVRRARWRVLTSTASNACAASSAASARASLFPSGSSATSVPPMWLPERAHSVARWRTSQISGEPRWLAGPLTPPGARPPAGGSSADTGECAGRRQPGGRGHARTPGGSPNKPFEWTGHHQLSASPPTTLCLPLKDSVGRTG
jgi:hypothetical protein